MMWILQNMKRRHHQMILGVIMTVCWRHSQFTIENVKNKAQNWNCVLFFNVSLFKTFIPSLGICEKKAAEAAQLTSIFQFDLLPSKVSLIHLFQMMRVVLKLNQTFCFNKVMNVSRIFFTKFKFISLFSFVLMSSLWRLLMMLWVWK